MAGNDEENTATAPNAWIAIGQTKEQRDAATPLVFVGSAWIKTFEDGGIQVNIQLGNYNKDTGKRLPVKLLGTEKLIVRMKKAKKMGPE